MIVKSVHNVLLQGDEGLLLQHLSSMFDQIHFSYVYSIIDIDFEHNPRDGPFYRSTSLAFGDIQMCICL